MFGIPRTASAAGSVRHAAIILTALLAGCNNSAPIAPPPGLLGPPGEHTHQTHPAGGAPAPRPPPREPPLNLSGTSGPLPAPEASGGPPRNGKYAGLGTVTNDPGGLCEN